MLNRFTQLISNPEDNDPNFARLIRNIIIITIVANSLVLLVTTGFFDRASADPIASTLLGVTLGLEIISLFFAVNGRPLIAKIVIPTGLMIAIMVVAINGNGVHDAGMVGLPIIIIIGVLLNRRKSIYIVTPIALAVAEFVVYADLSGITKSDVRLQTDVSNYVVSAVFVLLTSFLLQLMITRLESSIQQARANEQIQINTNKELIELQSSLEQRVEDRTNELARVSTINERRANQFQAISQVARAIASLQDIGDLLPTITRVISNRFGFYHVGIFLLDGTKQYAVLSAANSEGGQRMLQRGHRLRAGEVGIVGYTASTGIPRIALDTGADAVYFSNPDLPETRSEIALPLQISNNLIGVLDVQSIESNAYVQEDVETLSTLADQVAIAIRNAQLYQQSQISIMDTQVFMGNYLIDTWKSASKRNPGVGYRFLGVSPTPLEETVDSPEVQTAVNEGRIVSATKGKSAILAVPIKIRDEVIGVINVNAPADHEWSVDELDMIQAAVQRTALALENAALIEETQRRASKERIISEISTRISGTLDIDNLLQTTIQEMARAIPGAEVAIQLENEGVDKV